MIEYYTGIGSRETPEDVLLLLRDSGAYFARKGYALRSGGADGADFYCELGCRKESGEKEIYLPWRNFNDNESNLFPENLDNWFKAMTLAEYYHPNWNYLNQGVKKMHTRNVFQILGKSLDTPSKFVLCYAEIKYGVEQGGTSQAIRIARDYDVPVINLFTEHHKKLITKKIYTK